MVKELSMDSTIFSIGLNTENVLTDSSAAKLKGFQNIFDSAQGTKYTDKTSLNMSSENIASKTLQQSNLNNKIGNKPRGKNYSDITNTPNRKISRNLTTQSPNDGISPSVSNTNSEINTVNDGYSFTVKEALNSEPRQQMQNLNTSKTPSSENMYTGIEQTSNGSRPMDDKMTVDISFSNTSKSIKDGNNNFVESEMIKNSDISSVYIATAPSITEELAVTSQITESVVFDNLEKTTDENVNSTLGESVSDTIETEIDTDIILETATDTAVNKVPVAVTKEVNYTEQFININTDSGVNSDYIETNIATSIETSEITTDLSEQIVQNNKINAQAKTMHEDIQVAADKTVNENDTVIKTSNSGLELDDNWEILDEAIELEGADVVDENLIFQNTKQKQYVDDFKQENNLHNLPDKFSNTSDKIQDGTELNNSSIKNNIISDSGKNEMLIPDAENSEILIDEISVDIDTDIINQNITNISNFEINKASTNDSSRNENTLNNLNTIKDLDIEVETEYTANNNQELDGKDEINIDTSADTKTGSDYENAGDYTIYSGVADTDITLSSKDFAGAEISCENKIDHKMSTDKNLRVDDTPSKITQTADNNTGAIKENAVQSQVKSSQIKQNAETSGYVLEEVPEIEPADNDILEDEGVGLPKDSADTNIEISTQAENTVEREIYVKSSVKPLNGKIKSTDGSKKEEVTNDIFYGADIPEKDSDGAENYNTEYSESNLNSYMQDCIKLAYVASSNNIQSSEDDIIANLENKFDDDISIDTDVEYDNDTVYFDEDIDIQNEPQIKSLDELVDIDKFEELNVRLKDTNNNLTMRANSTNSTTEQIIRFAVEGHSGIDVSHSNFSSRNISVQYSPPEINTGVSAKDVMEQLSEKLSTFNFKSGSKLTMQLSPENLGTIEIKLTNSSNGINAEMTVSSDETKTLMSRNIDDLKDTLQKYGVRFDNVTLKTNSAQQSSTEHDYTEQGNSQKQTPDGRKQHQREQREARDFEDMVSSFTNEGEEE